MKVLFLINSKRRDQGPDSVLLRQFDEILKASGIDYRTELCESLEQSRTCIESGLVEGFDTIWIGGGDGTLNHVLNCTYGRNVVYGIVPMGTVNALARSLGLPIDPVQAVRYLLEAKPVPMDIGEVDRHHFFTYATVGLHAAVFHNINVDLKKRWGKLAFWESAAKTVWNKSRLPRFLMEMELADAPPGEHIIRDYGYSLTISNLANYAGWSTITRERPASPGYFELHHFRKNRLMPMFIWFTLLRLLGIEKSRPQSGQIFRLIRWVEVRSHRKLSVQIDGEPIDLPDRKRLRFVCLNDAVKIMLRDPEAINLTNLA